METDEKALYLAAWYLSHKATLGIFSSWGGIPLRSATLIVGGWYCTELSGYLKSARDCQVFRQGSAMIY